MVTIRKICILFLAACIWVQLALGADVVFKAGYEDEIVRLFQPFATGQVLDSGFIFSNIVIVKNQITARFLKDESWFTITLTYMPDADCDNHTANFCVTTTSSDPLLLDQNKATIVHIVTAVQANDKGQCRTWLLNGIKESPIEKRTSNSKQYLAILLLAIILIAGTLLLQRSKRQTRSELSYSKKALFSTIVVLVILSTVEFGLRKTVDLESLPLLFDLKHNLGTTHCIYDKDLLWKQKPNTSEQSNFLGLRDALQSPEKKANLFRILSLGESTTFGYGIRAQDCYSEVLETMLTQSWKRPVEVVNAGMIAYSSFQMRRFLELYGEHFSPDMVILYSEGNDKMKTIDCWGRMWTDSEIAKRNAELSPVISLLNRFYIYRLLRQNLISQSPVLISDTSRVPPEEREENLRFFINWCQEQEVGLIFIHPMYRDTKPHECILTQLAEKKQVMLVDLPKRFIKRKVPIEACFLDNLHPNERGHRIMAEEIYQRLMKGH